MLPVGFFIARDKHRHTNAHITRIRTYKCQEIEAIDCSPWKKRKKKRKRQASGEGIRQ